MLYEVITKSRGEGDRFSAQRRRDGISVLPVGPDIRGGAGGVLQGKKCRHDAECRQGRPEMFPA